VAARPIFFLEGIMAYQKIWWKRWLGAFLLGLPISLFLGWLVSQLGWLALAVLFVPIIILVMLITGGMLMDGAL
jgi:hypothetical protein